MQTTGQGQGQVKWAHHMKLQHGYRVTHILWVIWHYNLMMILIFTFHLRSGQVQVKKGQISNIEIFILKTHLSCPVLSENSKNVICFVVPQLKIPKNRASKKVISLPFLYFLGHCTAKNKDVGLKFCTLVGGTQLYNI